MEDAELWLTPLVLLPGVALLIVATSVRCVQLHSEFHHILAAHTQAASCSFQNLLKRSVLLRDALVGQYISVALFSMASLLGGLARLWDQQAFWIVVSLACVGILSLVVASAQLILEALLPMDIIKEHVREIEAEKLSCTLFQVR